MFLIVEIPFQFFVGTNDKLLLEQAVARTPQSVVQLRERERERDLQLGGNKKKFLKKVKNYLTKLQYLTMLLHYYNLNLLSW